MKKLIFNSSDRKGLEPLLSNPEQCNAELIVRREMSQAPLSVNTTDRTVEFVMSDESKDYAGDIIRQAGWDFEVFKKNPIMPWCHDYYALPIGKWLSFGVKGTQLIGVAQFMKLEDSKFADEVFRAICAGMLKGVSVGFNPTRWNAMRDEKQGFLGYEFLEQTLLECSVCSVPMNSNALARSPGAPATPEILSRLEKAEAEIETLKAVHEDPEDADGKLASSQAATSAELAKVLEGIAAIRTLCA